MKVTRICDALGRTVYRVELSEYDAEPPTREWILDDAPLRINPDLETIALYLIFGPWCGGEFTVPSKMSPNTAAAISRHAGFDFFCSPVEYYPKRLPGGTGSMYLTDDLADLGRNTVVSLFAGDWNGAIRSTHSAIVANNGSLFDVEPGRMNSVLALGVLFADELAASNILLRSDVPDAGNIQDLLREIGLRFETVSSRL